MNILRNISMRSPAMGRELSISRAGNRISVGIYPLTNWARPQIAYANAKQSECYLYVGGAGASPGASLWIGPAAFVITGNEFQEIRDSFGLRVSGTANAQSV